MMLRCWFTGIIVTSLSLGGCSNVEAGNNTSQESAKAIDGYGPYKFGMSFDETILAGGTVGFNSWSVKECRKFMPTVGCMLNPDRDRYTYPLIDGMEFAPELEFNRFGKLTDIGQQYSQDEGISSKDCLGLAERSLDRLVHENGQMSALREPEKSSDGWEVMEGSTPAKNRYHVSVKKDDKNFIFDHMRSNSDSKNAPHVELFAHYINKDCMIKITYRDHLDIERVNLSRLIELSK